VIWHGPIGGVPLAIALANKWREEAEMLRRRGAQDRAKAVVSCAEDLEKAFREYELEALTLEEAALESGYSYSALQKQVAAGQLLNVGERMRPRVRRGDLPRKGRSSVAIENTASDLATMILSDT